MVIDKIGYYRGQAICEMTHEKLLDFAAYAMKEIERLKRMELETLDYRIEKEFQRKFHKS